MALIPTDSIAWWPSVGVLVTAAVIDASTRRIPDWLSLPFLAAGILLHVAVGGWAGGGKSLAGVGLAALLFGPACALRLMGMGDLKLSLGVGAWIGAGQFVFAFLFSGIVAGLIAAAYALLHRPSQKGAHCSEGPMPHAATTRPGAWPIPRLGDRRALAIPYAPAFAVGTLFSFFGR